MRTTSIRLFLLFSAIAATVGMTANPVRSQTVTFRNISDNTGSFQIFSFAPAINNKGTVVFQSVLNSGTFGIYQVRNGTTTVVADTSQIFDVLYTPRINNNDSVAFLGQLKPGGGDAIYTGTDGTLTRVAGAGGVYGFQGSFPYFPDINDEGTVTFNAYTNLVGQGIFQNSNDNTTPVVLESSQLNNFCGPMINDSGEIVFGAWGDFPDMRIFKYVNGSIRLVYEPGELIRDAALGALEINNSGRVAFVGRLMNGNSGVIIGDGNDFRIVGDTLSGYELGLAERSGALFSLNNEGSVAFLARRESDDVGLYEALFRYESPYPVLKVGDPLFGSTVSSLLLHESGLNDNNQIAFAYKLENGVSGIAVADVRLSAVAPEPSTLNLIAGAILGAMMSGALRMKARFRRCR